MTLWERLFRKSPSANDIRVQLKEVDREHKKRRRDLEIREQLKAEKIREATLAKKAGKQELLRDGFRELRQMEIENGHLNADLRRLSLAKTALTSFVRRVEMLEASKDRRSLQHLVIRFKDSPIQREIDKAEVDDDTFNAMLEDILGSEEMTVASTRIREDAGFAEFDRAIGEMLKAETGATPDEEVSRLHDDIDRSIKAEKLSA